MLLDEGLANPASTSSLEDDVLKSFSEGQNALNLNWTFQLATANDPKQSKVAGQCAILHTPAGPSGKAPGCNGGQPVMITAPAEAPRRGVGVHQVHLQPAAAEPVRNRLAADLVGLLHRPGGDQAGRQGSRRRREDAARRT